MKIYQEKGEQQKDDDEKPINKKPTGINKEK